MRGQPAFQNRSGWAHSRPGSHTLDLLCHFFALGRVGVISSHRRWASLWDRELGCGQLWLEKSSFVAQGERKLPPVPLRTSQGNADWHRGNHILTCPKHAIPIRPCFPLWLQQKTKLAGLSQNACLSARYLAVFLRIHTTLQKLLWIPADRSPTQISSSQTWNLLLT